MFGRGSGWMDGLVRGGVVAWVAGDHGWRRLLDDWRVADGEVKK